MRRGVLALLLTLLLVGAGGGYAWRWLDQPSPATAGTAEPLPVIATASSTASYAADPDYPALKTYLTYEPVFTQGLTYYVPRGWHGWPEGEGWRWHPTGRPDQPIYSVHVRPLDEAPTASAPVDQLAALRGRFSDVLVVSRDEDTLNVRFRDDEVGTLRFNIFRWLTFDDGTGAVVSVVGRAEDVDALPDLLEGVAGHLRPEG